MAAIESTVVHVFRKKIWCPSSCSVQPDEAFWSLAHRLLNHSQGNNNTIVISRCLVLGIPLSLLRLLSHLVHYFRSPTCMGQQTRSLFMAEVAFWESTLCETCISNSHDKPHGGNNDDLERVYRDTTTLYILAASFLLHCCCEEVNQDCQGNLDPPFTHFWQIEKALGILREAKENNKWVECYIGSWPVFFLGYGVVRSEDIELVRADLRERWSLTSLWEFRRMIDELETFWSPSQ